MCDMPSHNDQAPHLKHLAAHVSPELAAEVQRRAELDGRSTSGWIRQQLARALEAPQEERKPS